MCLNLRLKISPSKSGGWKTGLAYVQSSLERSYGQGCRGCRGCMACSVYLVHAYTMVYSVCSYCLVHACTTIAIGFMNVKHRWYLFTHKNVKEWVKAINCARELESMYFDRSCQNQNTVEMAGGDISSL